MHIPYVHITNRDLVWIETCLQIYIDYNRAGSTTPVDTSNNRLLLYCCGKGCSHYEWVRRDSTEMAHGKKNGNRHDPLTIKIIPI